MNNTKFIWGKVLDRFTFVFDGEVLEVTKYYPVMNKVQSDTIEYHCEEMHSSYDNMFALVIAWITFKKLGHNQHALASGICRALEIKG